MTPSEALGAGLSVLPCGRNKKPQLTAWKQYQTRQATEAEFQKWCKLNPAVWAMVTGVFSRRITADFDGEQGRETMERLGLKPHRRTPSGSFHVDLVHPGWPVPTLNSRTDGELKKRWPGMDVRGDGGYACFSGGTARGAYEWLRGPEPDDFNMLPEDLRQFLRSRKPSAVPEQRTNGKPHALPANGRVDAERLIHDALERAGSQGRNNCGLWLATQLRDNGYSQTEAESAMRDYRGRVSDTNTKGEREPYTQTEMRATLREAYSRAARQPWERKAAPEPIKATTTRQDPLELPVRQQGARPEQQAQVTRGPVLLQAKDALAIYKAMYPPIECVIGDLLPNGLTLAAGRPKVGKSWLALQLAVAVAFGELALGRFHVANPGRVTYLALEEPLVRTHRRLREIVPAEDVRLQNIQFLHQVQPLMTGGAAQLDAFLTANPSKLVVIDTLLAFVSAHSGRRDILRGDYTEVNTLRQIAEKHETAILCVAHARKAAGDLVDSIIGTSGTTAACDSVWALRRLNTGEACLEVKGRELEEAQYALKFNTGKPFGWVVIGEGADVGLSEQRREILLLLQQEGAKKPGDIARLLGNKNINTVRRLIQNLAHDGVIQLQNNGTYVPCHGVNAVNA